MKKFFNIKNKARLLFFIAGGLFVFSCGLEDVVYINEPTKVFQQCTFSNEDYTAWYCSFETNEQNQDLDGTNSFTGTDIYYKIYNNSSNLNSDLSTITSANNSTTASASYNALVNKGFQSLKYGYSDDKTIRSNAVIVPNEGDDRVVTFRLKTYTSNENYQGENFEAFRACFKIDGKILGKVNGISGLVYLVYDNDANIWNYSTSYNVTPSNPVAYEDITFIIPLRSNGYTFDFFDDEETDLDTHVEPIGGDGGDSDYNCNDSYTEENTYFVQLFAIGVGFDGNSLGNIYSKVLDLGSISIKKGK